MNRQLLLAFEGPGGEELMRWCILNGHIHNELSENPTELVEHNVIKRLFHEAGIKVLPVIPRTDADIPDEPEETNLIDSILEEQES